MLEEEKYLKESEFIKATSKHIRYYRNYRGMTQEELAEQAQISTNHLKSIERGKSSPSFFVIFKLAKALNIEFGLLAKDIDKELDVSHPPEN